MNGNCARPSPMFSKLGFDEDEKGEGKATRFQPYLHAKTRIREIGSVPVSRDRKSRSINDTLALLAANHQHARLEVESGDWQHWLSSADVHVYRQYDLRS